MNYSASFRSLAWGAILISAVSARAQAPLIVYGDGLTNAFQDWSWAAHNLANITPVHGGTRSISVNGTPSQGISFYHPDFDISPYATFSFWLNGGAAGGQRLQVYAQYGANGQGSTYVLPGPLTANAWQQFTIPLSTLGVSNRPNANRFTIQMRNDGTSGGYFADDIQFDPRPLPALVNISLNATQAIRTVDARHFGVNLAIWDIYYDPPNNATTTALMREMGATAVRLPGGSLSDEYHWASNKSLTNTWEWQASFGDFMSVTTNVGIQGFIVVNYGSGTPEEAAGWVRHANITNQFGYKYWEIGNECYGSWETDTNANPHDPYTYAVRASNYIAQMRAADPTIKIGVVAATGEGSYSNQFTPLHPAFNPRTGQTTYGWTPILLTTLRNMGVIPDFIVHHVYPQWTNPMNVPGSPDNDTGLLLSTGNWAADAADLRQQISDYVGPAGTNIELVCTENNSDSGAQGRQSTSLINGLYYADSLAQLLKTEFKGFVWWDLRNGTDNTGFFGSNLYGWRNYGDLGMINGLSTRHPSFYAAKLLQHLARPGDKVLNVSSDYPWLSVCAARRASGAVTLLAINKFNVTNLTAQISIAGFAPRPAATARSYGIFNDEAARTNGPAASRDLTTNNFATASTNFAYAFPRYSVTVVTLVPDAPRLEVLPGAVPGQFVFQLQGQPNVRYVLQSSSNLTAWASVATNTLTSNSLNVTNQATTPIQFWRAVWQP